MQMKLGRPQVVAAACAAAVIATGTGGYAVGHHVSASKAQTVSAAKGRWLPDALPPADPFDLLQGHWPTLSEGALSVIRTTIYGTTFVPPQLSALAAAPWVVPTAAQVAADFTVVAADVLAPMHIDTAALRAHGADANRLAALFEHAADQLMGTKAELRIAVADGTAEAESTPAGPARDAVVAQYRSKIADMAGELTTELTKVGQMISTPIEGSDPAKTGVSIFHLTQPDGSLIRVNAAGFEVKSHRIVGDAPLVVMPPVPPAQDTVETPTR